MSDETARLALPLLQPSQAQKHVTHNEAIDRLDFLVQLTVKGFDAIVPPAAPEAGEAWALDPGAIGAWAGHGSKLASWRGEAWVFATPQPGWIAAGPDGLRFFEGSGWVPISGEAAFQNLGSLGINATADLTNRLSLSSDATLLNHDGSGHQLKINKSAVADTASLLFQSNWSGRAEMGLAGSDQFAIKVSPDGSSFSTALEADSTTGRLSAPGGLRVFDGTATAPSLGFAADPDCGFYRPGTDSVALATGGAQRVTVNASGLNVTSGELMKNGSPAYCRSNVLGPVAQAAGVPTGALIETGSGANGRFLRFADGTLICTIEALAVANCATADGTIFRSAGVTWTYPSVFVQPPVLSGTVADADCWISAAAPSVTSCSLRARSSVSKSGALTIRAVAHGRWF